MKLIERYGSWLEMMNDVASDSLRGVSVNPENARNACGYCDRPCPKCFYYLQANCKWNVEEFYRKARWSLDRGVYRERPDAAAAAPPIKGASKLNYRKTQESR